jgi:hypothetical protein
MVNSVLAGGAADVSVAGLLQPARAAAQTSPAAIVRHALSHFMS